MNSHTGQAGQDIATSGRWVFLTHPVVLGCAALVGMIFTGLGLLGAGIAIGIAIQQPEEIALNPMQITVQAALTATSIYSTAVAVGVVTPIPTALNIAPSAIPTIATVQVPVLQPSDSDQQPDVLTKLAQLLARPSAIVGLFIGGVIYLGIVFFLERGKIRQRKLAINTREDFNDLMKLREQGVDEAGIQRFFLKAKPKGISVDDYLKSIGENG